MQQPLSEKINFVYLVSMISLVFIHGNTLDNSAFNTINLNSDQFSYTSFIETLLVNGLLRFRIPLLLMISGYLLSKSVEVSYIALVIKKIKSLLIPYVLISAISLLVVFVLEEIFFKHYKEGLWGIKINEYDPKKIIYHLIVSPIAYQLWYLKILFVFILSYPIVRFLLNKIPILFLTALFFFWILFDHSLAFKNIRFYFFFVIGVQMQIKKINVIDKPNWLSISLFACMYIVFGLTKAYLSFFGKKILGSMALFSVRILFNATVLTGIIVIWYGSAVVIKYVGKKKWYHQLSGYSFFIYAFHAPLINLLIDPYLKIFDQMHEYKIIVFLTLPLAVIAICILFDELVRKTSLNFYLILTGVRGNSKNKHSFDGYVNVRSGNTYNRINQLLAKRYYLFATHKLS